MFPELITHCCKSLEVFKMQIKQLWGSLEMTSRPRENLSSFRKRLGQPRTGTHSSSHNPQAPEHMKVISLSVKLPDFLGN